MKILVYGNRKIDDIYWDASTPEKERAALRCLFNYLKDSWKSYGSLENADKLLADVQHSLETTDWDQIPEGHPLYKEAQEKKQALLAEQKQASEDVKQARLYRKALDGDDSALRHLLSHRVDYEYERWFIETVTDPLKKD